MYMSVSLMSNDVSVSLMMMMMMMMMMCVCMCVQAELMEELNKYKKLGKLS